MIDVLLSNTPELFKHSGKYYSLLSDDALIYGVLKERVNPNKPKLIIFRSYKNVETDVFKQHLATAPWYIGQLFGKVDDQAHSWNLLINDILDELAPIKSMRVRDNDVPYMTSEWKSAIRAKRKATSKYLKKQNTRKLGAQAESKKRSYKADKDCDKGHTGERRREISRLNQESLF